jgi:hypothetical protein
VFDSSVSQLGADGTEVVVEMTVIDNELTRQTARDLINVGRRESFTSFNRVSPS